MLSRFVDCPEVDLQLYSRFLKCAQSAIHSTYRCIRCVATCARLALVGSVSTFCRNLTFRSHKYHFERVLMNINTNANIDVDGRIRAGS